MAVQSFPQINQTSEEPKTLQYPDWRSQWIMIAMLTVLTSIVMVVIGYERVRSHNSPGSVSSNND